MIYNEKEFHQLKTHSLYFISRDGEVYSMIKNRLLKPGRNNVGYKQVWLKDDKGNSKWKRIHVLVCQQFNTNYFELKEANHRNGDKDNNNDWNLVWSTHKDNIKHAQWLGLRPKPMGMKDKTHSDDTKLLMSKAKLGRKHPKYIGQFITPWGKFSSANQAGTANNMQPKTVLNRCKSSRYKHLGYDFIPK